ncbi:hypothetical protein HDU85_001021 [Gaertneriomyces sp. JEL0708]|nr:hypothetical protein HDU85_001021 [Gaertneriomyces sp. JEL0708]
MSPVYHSLEDVQLAALEIQKLVELAGTTLDTVWENGTDANLDSDNALSNLAWVVNQTYLNISESKDRLQQAVERIVAKQKELST